MEMLVNGVSEWTRVECVRVQRIEAAVRRLFYDFQMDHQPHFSF